MKYSFMSFSTPEMSFAEMLEAAQRFGYDGVEPRIDAGHAHGVEVTATADQREQFVRQADDAGVAIACVATSLRYADPAAVPDVLKQTRERIDLASDLGAPTMRVFGGKLAEGLSREDAIDLVAGSLSKVADHAGECGVTICMETHDDWCNPDHVAAVLSRVNHPAVACNWDIMHPVRTGEATIDESFESLKLWVRHLHIHDGTGGGIGLTPIGEGIIDHKRTIELLATIDYEGFLSGEWINWDDAWDIHLPREIATLRRYEEELA
jgi:sugar phosphate isomerase/epimerase